MSLVLARGHAAPFLSDDVSERCILLALLHTGTIPFVSQFLPYLDSLYAAVYPFVGITETLVVCYGLVNIELRILHLVKALGSYLSHPYFERLCLW